MHDDEIKGLGGPMSEDLAYDTADSANWQRHVEADRHAINARGGAFIGRGLQRVRAKGEEAREALALVLQSLDMGVSLESLESAIATVRNHLKAA